MLGPPAKAQSAHVPDFLTADVEDKCFMERFEEIPLSLSVLVFTHM